MPREAEERTPQSGWRRAGLAVRVVHPVPSLLVAMAVAVLSYGAGAPATTVALLAVGMVGFQFSIGALNDLADADPDRLALADKPIPRGVVSKRAAAVLAGAGALVGIVVSAAFGPLVLLLGMAGWGCGVAYDLWLRRIGAGWVAFALALPILLAWTWNASDTLPPGWPFLLVVATLTGPVLHLANSLVDVEADRRVGRRTLATAFGRRRSRPALVALLMLVLVLALLAIVARGPVSATQAVAYLMGAGVALVGAGLAWATARRLREAGWLLLATGLVSIAAAWAAG